MKLLHVISDLAIGGAEMMLFKLLSAIDRSHFEPSVISLMDKGAIGQRIESLGVPVYSVGMRRGLPSPLSIWKLRRLVRQLQPDLIQGWMYHGNLAATLARTLSPGRPVLVWNIRHSLYDMGHEKPMTRQVIRANRFFSAAPDALLYNSVLSRKQHEEFGLASRNGRVIPNGIDVRRFSFSGDARKSVRSELGIPADAQVVGHVARLHPMKDHPGFLQAAAGLALRYPEAHFLLSGRNVSLDNKSLEQLVSVRVRDRFHLLGERRDVHELMSAMDVFCQSSWSEAFPNVLGEAMATGLPCVATDVGDCAIVIDDTGVLVPPRDVGSLAAGIESLLKMSPEKRRTMGASARARIKTNYMLNAIVEQYAALYNTLVT